LVRNGQTVDAWAAENGYKRKLVYAVLSGERRCIRGLSREIAHKLHLIGSPSSPEAGKDTPSPAGHTIAGAGAAVNFDRTGNLQLVGEPAQ
jgi:gp16 family phage-associated protein